MLTKEKLMGEGVQSMTLEMKVSGTRREDGRVSSNMPLDIIP